MTVTTANSVIEPDIGDSKRLKKNISSERFTTPSGPRREPPRSASSRAEQPDAARQARRHGWGGARQADRHDLDPAVAVVETAVHRPSAPAMRHAPRAARLRRPADRARGAHQNGSVRDGRPQALSLHGGLGRGRDTDDTEGRATQTSDLRPSVPRKYGAATRFTGVIEQIPPQYSAIKVQGERAYDLARDGETST